jgi:hypothetical protein
VRIKKTTAGEERGERTKDIPLKIFEGEAIRCNILEKRQNCKIG